MGGLEELRKKYPAELSQRKKKSCNTDGQEKKCLHKLRGKKKFPTIPGNALCKGCSPGNINLGVTILLLLPNSYLYVSCMSWFDNLNIILTSTFDFVHRPIDA